ncbi:hypothetical protein QT381_10860 [Galbitalea sp. SE-J8]|uniref:hypothetical protein n=1 Tax=Galbitalea sp. SE-J8 TaxID=3054952 RepID=UPI00259CAA55|nr:hypothetical protein [Galbitalea sp. SE-J8]MDM4763510.1 hypothetical protein [Galbitalea sp. SE-J8]
MGNYLVIRFGDGNRAAFGHLSAYNTGMTVADTTFDKGKKLADSGGTGCVGGVDHEHFSMFKGSWLGWASTHFFDGRAFLTTHGVGANGWTGQE